MSVETLLRILFGCIVLGAALVIGLSTRPSGIYQPDVCHYSPQHSCLGGTP